MSGRLYRDSRDWAERHRHPQPDDRMLALTGAAALRDMANRIDRGPAVPLPPSVISALVRERATDLTVFAGGVTRLGTVSGMDTVPSAADLPLVSGDIHTTLDGKILVGGVQLKSGRYDYAGTGYVLEVADTESDEEHAARIAAEE